MAQRQFRSTDTDRWLHGFGQKGNIINVSVDGVLPNGYSAINALAGAQPAVSDFAEGDILLIHKSRGALANVSPTWELNRKQLSALQYALTREFATDGGNEKSQIVKAVVCKKFLLTAGATLSITPWNYVNGLGGLGVIIADEVDLSGGTLDLRGAGFEQGHNGGDYTGGQAEGWPAPGLDPYGGAGTNAGRQRNGNSPGSGTGTNSGSETQPGAGGAANKNNGADGSQGTSTAGAPNGSFGIGGQAAGNDDLSCLVFSGAGSVGAGHVDGSGWYPGRGAGRGTASLIIICRRFKAPLRIIADGTDALSLLHPNSGGSSGSAGANVLVQGQEIDLGSGVITAAAGVSATRAGGSSVGRIAARYSRSIAGTTSPAADVTQDEIYDQFSVNQALPFLI